MFGLGRNVEGVSGGRGVGEGCSGSDGMGYGGLCWDMVSGVIGGCMGERSVIGIGIGGVIVLW